MADARPVVLVDARNVLRSRWPNIPEAEVVERTCRWAAETGVDAVVVFDGRAPARVPETVPETGTETVPETETACAVVGTAGEIADDWIAREAARLAAAGLAYWLVTSDRGLRERAAGAAERVIGGGAFATLIGRPTRRS